MSRSFIQLAKQEGLVHGDFLPFKIKEFVEGSRLFYEVGYYTSKHHTEENWKRTGRFIEIEDIPFFLDFGKEDIKNQKFIDHHNFVCLPPV